MRRAGHARSGREPGSAAHGRDRPPWRRAAHARGTAHEWNETEAAAGRRGVAAGLRKVRVPRHRRPGQRPTSRVWPRHIERDALRKSSRSRVWFPHPRFRPAVPEMSWMRITSPPGPRKPSGTCGTPPAATPAAGSIPELLPGELFRTGDTALIRSRVYQSSTGPPAMRVLCPAGLLLGLLTLPACVGTEEFTVCKVETGIYRGRPPRCPSDFEQPAAAGVRTILDMQVFRPQGSEQEALSGLGVRHRLPQLSGLALARRHGGDRAPTAACCARRITRSTSTATPAGIAPVCLWACTGSVARAGSPRPPTTR